MPNRTRLEWSRAKQKRAISHWFRFNASPENNFNGEPFPMSTKKPLSPVVEVVSASESTAAPNAKPPKKIITFTVKRIKTDGNFEVIPSDTYATIPPVNDVIYCLPPKVKKAVSMFYLSHNYYSLNELMITHYPQVSCEDWAEALAKAVVLSETMKHEGTFSAVEPIKSAYVALDDVLYALKPVAMVGTNRALATMRKKAQADVKVYADQLRKRAEEEANRITQDAARSAGLTIANAAQKMREAEAKLRGAAAIPPAWAIATGFPLIGADNQWRIVLPCNMTIKKFVYTYEGDDGTNFTRTWPAKEAPPVTFRYSAALGESFNITGLKNLDFNHPHMVTYKSCMQPGDAPRHLNNVNDVSRLISAVDRTLQAIDMNSMLAEGRTPSWSHQIWRFVPKDLEELIRANLHSSDAVQTALRKNAREEAAKLKTPPPTTGSIASAPVSPISPTVVAVTPSQEYSETWHSS